MRMFPIIVVQHVFMLLDVCPVLCLTLFIPFIPFVLPSQKQREEVVSCNQLAPCGHKQMSHRWFADLYMLCSFQSRDRSHGVPCYVFISQKACTPYTISYVKHQEAMLALTSISVQCDFASSLQSEDKGFMVRKGICNKSNTNLLKVRKVLCHQFRICKWSKEK